MHSDLLMVLWARDLASLAESVRPGRPAIPENRLAARQRESLQSSACGSRSERTMVDDPDGCPNGRLRPASRGLFP